MESQTVAERIAQLKRELKLESRARSPRSPRPPRPATPAPTPTPRKGRRSTLGDVVLGIAAAGTAVALPFVVYVRASVSFYMKGASPWLAVVGAALLTVAVFAAYGRWLSRRLPRGRGVWVTHYVAIPGAVAWCLYAALYLSRVNAKSDEVRGYHSVVHPVLRVALGTAIFVDQSMVVTDMRRVPEDYVRMGLPINDRTLHYRQSDGWVHAVDLRTRERGELRNRALQLYFRIMGFSTLRHVGTADHLHVQLLRRG